MHFTFFYLTKFLLSVIVFIFMFWYLLGSPFWERCYINKLYLLTWFTYITAVNARKECSGNQIRFTACGGKNLILLSTLLSAQQLFTITCSICTLLCAQNKSGHFGILYTFSLVIETLMQLCSDSTTHSLQKIVPHSNEKTRSITWCSDSGVIVSLSQSVTF